MNDGYFKTAEKMSAANNIIFKTPKAAEDHKTTEKDTY
jgi:hypothetical protein